MLKAIVFTLFMLMLPSSTFAADNNDQLFIVHFETGKNWDKALLPQEQSKFQAHSKNLNTLRKQNVIIFGARYGELGVIVLKANSLVAAKAIIAAVPGVQSGIFEFTIEVLNVFYPWQEK